MNMPIRNDTWTEERVAKLKELWETGQSCSQIAASLGCFDHCFDRGRSAVIGKIHRLKLPRPDGKQPRYKVATRPKVPRPAPTLRRNQTNSLAAKLAIAEAEPGLTEHLKGERPDGTGVKLIELTDLNCHFPLGDPLEADFEFCGKRSIEGYPYCARHCRISFVAPSERRTYPHG